MFGQRDTNANDNTNNPSGAPTAPATNAAFFEPTNNMTISSVATAPSFSSTSIEPAIAPPASTPSSMQFSAPVDSDDTDELVRMKQEALQHLQPLVDTLQQSPEEEFRTIMMMIQATDDKTMLKKALESAKRIKDDKIRAQAMLDVINEINYFTQTSAQE